MNWIETSSNIDDLILLNLIVFLAAQKYDFIFQTSKPGKEMKHKFPANVCTLDQIKIINYNRDVEFLED